jgi:hypothetical protein
MGGSNVSCGGRRLRLGAAVAATSVATALLASASTAATAGSAWADQVCLAVNSWQNDVETSVTSFRRGAAPVTSRRLLARIDLLRARTAALGAALQSIGSPDVPDGDSAQGALENAVATVRRNLAEDRSTVAGRAARTYPASSPWLSSLLAGLHAQGKVVGGVFVNLGTLFPDANLDTYFEQIPLCEVIHG